VGSVLCVLNVVCEIFSEKFLSLKIELFLENLEQETYAKEGRSEDILKENPEPEIFVLEIKFGLNILFCEKILSKSTKSIFLRQKSQI